MCATETFNPLSVIPAEAGHAVKLLRYPEKDWMPDQARHDGIGYFVARLILKILAFLLHLK
jgi:hypothetical protein